ncbi:MAG: serine hydrolase domain-containing protein [Armatimonadota bacterium]|nr:serine hydrolase domain-containing protein [Armatimonadota bacterium]MDR7519677.1 serine hydrolase domain-containing protein [Armatimonadota bacterium]MDR7550763.1 serine hydrolase domain-containing protein [Armatimonadota bacterium]
MAAARAGPASRAGGAARRVREAVRAHLRDGMAQGVFPGAVAAVIWGGATLALEAHGFAQVVPRRRPMTPQTIFDLASVTKPVATTTAVLQLWERGLLDVDAPVCRYLPGFADGGKERVTVRHLLAHTSGLPAWEMLYLPAPSARCVGSGARARACRSIDQAVGRICATPAASSPGVSVDYSDLGFIVLGHLVQRASGEELGAYCRRHIFGPLGMGWTRFVPPAGWRPRCAATEVGNAYEREKAAALGLGRRFPWRTSLLRGEVHDGNAWYLGRGVAGHAGLFGPAADLARFGMAMLRRGSLDGVRILGRETVREATRAQAPGPAKPPRGLGWALAGAPFAGSRASPSAFGHTGFTGTSVLVDPDRDLVVVLLTNRVHPSASNEAIQGFRGTFHDAVIGALDA